MIELKDLDEAIREWRDTLKSHPGYQRAIDVIDGLQQFRLRVAGSILPMDNGMYKVSIDNGKTYFEHKEESAAITAHKTCKTVS